MEAEKIYKSNVNCCVHECNSIHRKNPNLRFHTFPHPGKEKVIVTDDFNNEVCCDRRELWEIRLRMGKKVKNHMRVCSLHFVDDDYLTPACHSMRFLKKTAVPTQNLPRGSISNEPVKSKAKQVRFDRLCEKRKTEEESISKVEKAEQSSSEFYGMPLKKKQRLTCRKGVDIRGRSTRGIARRRENPHFRSIDVFFKKVSQAVNKLESETMYKVKKAIAKLVMNTEIEERQNECNEIAPTRNSRPTPKKMSADRATRKKPLDPVDQFFREIARTVKTLKPETSERLKTTIAELVMDAEIEQMEKKVKVEVEETEEDVKPQTGEMLEYVKLETEEVKLEVEESPNEEPSALDSL